jgi:hypothetical protein
MLWPCHLADVTGAMTFNLARLALEVAQGPQNVALHRAEAASHNQFPLSVNKVTD